MSTDPRPGWVFARVWFLLDSPFHKISKTIKQCHISGSPSNAQNGKRKTSSSICSRSCSTLVKRLTWDTYNGHRMYQLITKYYYKAHLWLQIVTTNWIYNSSGDLCVRPAKQCLTQNISNQGGRGASSNVYSNQ